MDYVIEFVSVRYLRCILTHEAVVFFCATLYTIAALRVDVRALMLFVYRILYVIYYCLLHIFRQLCEHSIIKAQTTEVKQ